MKIARYIVDLLMSILMLVCMCYQATGNLWHEIIGIVLFVLFITHCVLNRYWFIKYKTIQNKIKNAGNLKFAFYLNHIIILDMIIMAITSIMISKDVFGFLNIPWFGFVFKIHKLGAIAGFVLLSIHLGCHWKIIIIEIFKGLKIDKDSKSVKIICKIIAVAFIISGIYSAWQKVVGGKEHEKNDKTGKVEKATELNNINIQNNNKSNVVLLSNVSEAESLDDYLSKLTCPGCGRHCSLLNPRCGKGEEYKKQATEEFYEQNQTTTESTTEEKTIEETTEDKTTEQKDQTIEDKTTEAKEQTQQDKEEITEQQEEKTEENSKEEIKDSENKSPSSEFKPKVIIEGDENLLHSFMGYIPISGMLIAGTYYSIEFYKKQKSKKNDK